MKSPILSAVLISALSLSTRAAEPDLDMRLLTDAPAADASQTNLAVPLPSGTVFASFLGGFLNGEFVLLNNELFRSDRMDFPIATVSGPRLQSGEMVSLTFVVASATRHSPVVLTNKTCSIGIVSGGRIGRVWSATKTLTLTSGNQSLVLSAEASGQGCEE